jgi:hypothetical protein
MLISFNGNYNIPPFLPLADGTWRLQTQPKSPTKPAQWITAGLRLRYPLRLLMLGLFDITLDCFSVDLTNWPVELASW